METILSIILKEKKLIISCILASLGLFFIYNAFVYKPAYKTEAKIFIKNIPQYNVATETETGDDSVASQSGYSNPLFNIVQILQSESLSDKLYQYISLEQPEELKRLNIKSEKDFYDYYKKKFNTKIIPSTDTLTLSLNWTNKKLADDVLMETINQFKNENLEIRKSIVTKQSKYLDSYLQGIENKLTQVRKQIKNYRISKNVIDADQESNQVLLAKYALEKQITDLKSQINYNDRKFANYSRALGFRNSRDALRGTAIGQDPHLETLNDNLAAAQQRYSNLSSKFSDSYPEVLAAKNEIQSIKSSIRNRTKESLQNVLVRRGLYDKPSQDIATEMAQVQAETVSLRGQLAPLIKSMADLKNREDQLPTKISSLEDLRNQETALENIYSSFKRKQLDVKFKENGIVDNVFVLDYPSTPKKDNASVLLNLLGFLYAGALAGILAGWVKVNPKKLAIKSYKSIGILPFIEDPEYFQSEYSPNGLTKTTESVHGASYVNIASNIIKLSSDDGAKIISFSGTSPNRNSSFITLNIAASLAKLKKSVVLICSDYRCSKKIQEQFNVKSEINEDLLSIIRSINYEISISKYISNTYMNMLLQKSALKVKIDSMNNDNYFCILPAVNQVDNLYGYVLSNGFDEFISFLKSKYDFVLIDMPAYPANYPACHSLMQKTDLNIMIANNSVSSDAVDTNIKELKNSNLEVPYVISRGEEETYKIIKENSLTDVHRS